MIIETLVKILAVLEENRDLLKENRDLLIESRDLLKPSASYFDERKRLDLAEAERLERARFDKRVNELIEDGNKRIAGYLSRFVYEDGMILSSNSFYEKNTWKAIGCVDGVWFISERGDFENPSTIDKSNGYASIELAFREFLSRFK
jgi:hypothetical protein